MLYDLRDKKNFFSHCKSIQEHKNFKIIGGVDKRIDRGKIFKQKFKSNFYTNIKEALINCSPDIVIIATNTHTHFKVFNEVIKYAKPNLILFEKPLSLSYEESLKIFNISNKKQIKFFVNYIRISDISTRLIKTIIKNSKSKKYKIFVNYSKGLHNSCSHFISLLFFLFKDLGKIKFKKKIRKIKKIKDEDIDFKTSSKNLEITFNSTDYKDYSDNSLIIFGKKFKIEYLSGGSDIRYYKRNFDKNSNEYILKFEKHIKNDFQNYQLNVYNNLHNFLSTKKYFLSNEKDSMQIEKLINLLK